VGKIYLQYIPRASIIEAMNIMEEQKIWMFASSEEVVD